MRVPPQTIDFTDDDHAPVIAAMQRLSSAGHGSRWINIGPALSDEQAAHVPVRSGLAAWLSGRGPMVPMATWMPPAQSSSQMAQVGVEHGTGANALRRLADEGLGLPTEWMTRQDHAKHGIVVDLPPDTDHGEIVTWLVAACRMLSPELALGRRWQAIVHAPG